MATITISKQELRGAIKESVREALAEELIYLRAAFVPSVSEREQEDIERRYKIPSRTVAKSRTFRV